jgi:hypothetical protein
MSTIANEETNELAQEGLDILELQLTQQPPAGVTISEVAGFFRRQRPALVAALAGMLEAIAAQQPKRDPATGRAVSSGDRVQAELESLLEEGEEFQLVVLSGKDFHRFSITPDVDGLYVASDGSPNKERKLDRTDALALLDFLPEVCPPAAGGVLIAIRDSFIAGQRS